jgi:nucleotide-binding universal stress UspA family protein
VLAGVWVGAKTPVMAAILAEHGVDAELHTLSIGLGPSCLTLLSKVHGLGADMLVMSAYIDAPLRELLFGGATRYMLTLADISLLMRH